MRVLAATVRVKARGLRNRWRGHGDMSGLTVACDGRCGSPDPHDAHLARGAAAYLGRHRHV